MAEEKIREIEREISRTQVNKATAKHLGLLKARLIKLKAELIAPKSGGGGAGERGFEVTKSGDTRVGLVGFPSVGKSTLLTKLTGTASEAAAYEFTTLTAIPGTLHFRGARIQVLDLPGIIEGAKDGKGRGRQVIAAARTCNVIIIVLDASKPITMKKKIERELEGFGLRINKKRPNIVVRKKDKGGVTYRSLFPQSVLDEEVVRRTCAEFKYANAEIEVRYPDATVEELADVLDGRSVYIPAIYALNMVDKVGLEELDLLCSFPHFLPISASEEWGFDVLLDEIWEKCEMLRIYPKPKGQIPDFDEPVILHARRPTVEDFCNTIHRSISKRVRHAWVWGTSAKHVPQKVGLKHVLHDEDVVQLAIK